MSKIEWTEATWNPVVGCSIVSPGCTNCYAMKMAARIEAMGNQPRYAGTTHKVNGNAVWTGKLAQAPDSALFAPLHRRKPTTYFVNSMGDLFHEDCPDDWIDRVFAVMALCPQHTFQVLTKRAGRMKAYVNTWFERLATKEIMIDHPCGRRDNFASFVDWTIFPSILPNVWLGVSAERQKEANERVPDLIATPAAVRFVSCEPLLGHVALHALNLATDTPSDALRGVRAVPDDSAEGYRNEKTAKLDWVICGGESGPDARPMHPDWARHLRDWCKATDVPFFFKQWGNWHPEIDRDSDDPDWRQPYTKYREPNFQILNLAGGRGFHGERVHVMRYCSKKSAGRELDGASHDAMPPHNAHGTRPAHG